MKRRVIFFPRGIILFLVGCVLLAGNQPTPAGNKVTGELVSRGRVLVNGSGVPRTTTLFSGSRITTQGSGGAVASLGPLGQVYVDTDSELMLTFSETGAKIELFSGSVRLQKNAQTALEIITRKCTRVEVVRGTVQLANTENAPQTTNANLILKDGDLREFTKETTIFSGAQSSLVDYRVSIIECGVPAAAIPKPIFPFLPVAGALAGAGAAGAIPVIVKSGSPSPSRP